jgi:hypothetical protein
MHTACDLVELMIMFLPVILMCSAFPKCCTHMHRTAFYAVHSGLLRQRKGQGQGGGEASVRDAREVPVKAPSPRSQEPQEP